MRNKQERENKSNKHVNILLHALATLLLGNSMQYFIVEVIFKNSSI
jgi:hypothetical protein